ncbi:M20 family metallopeptidase [Paenibacillus tengchongensis]|uniref:M20 family metallopeptidase n=1 Tax=Paenibacillus tengchongensis TaxID=2608684 RepID=UPI00124D9583|nr:M20 family metallopeptidase [Paenibacillus tengchongensis]
MTRMAVLSEIIEAKRESFTALSDELWAKAEVAFTERQSAELLCGALEQEGFRVERQVAGLETGFVGSYGSGHPVIAILGEFDALPGLSQKAGLARPEPIAEGGNGHGCGHNLLGSGALAAAVAVKDYMQRTGLKGTVRYYGCPAEEYGSGKAYMARAGLFDDADLALSWHPYTAALVQNLSSLANYAVKFKFTGRSAHAAASPHLGRSALDAVELMNVGVNYLREHMIPEARVHYAITDSGGASPNVVQAYAEVSYLIRAPKQHQVTELYSRVYDIAKGAALMTGTSVETEFEGAAGSLIPNRKLAEVMHANLTAAGIPDYDAEDWRYAEAIRATLSPEDIQAALYGMDPRTALRLKDKAIADEVIPLYPVEPVMPGSTDVGDVSWVVPTAQCMTACWALGTALHTWQTVAQGTLPLAHKGMLQAAKTIAGTAIEALENPAVIAEAKTEHRERLQGQAYMPLIPEGQMPPRR